MSDRPRLDHDLREEYLNQALPFPAHARRLSSRRLGLLRCAEMVFLILVAFLTSSLLVLELAWTYRPQTARALLETFDSLGCG